MSSALARFSRPHTILATTIQVLALFLIVGGAPSRASLGPLLLVLITSLGLNVYVVGLNQITDIEIDRINKPGLPLASREMTLAQGRRLVALCGLAALVGALLAGPYLAATVLIIMAVGTIYSAPPLRLKRHPFLAATSIALARGAVANVGVALHFSQALPGLAPPSPLTLALLATFFFGFGLVIAIFKDIPDLAGDQIFGISTFSVTLGPGRAFDLGRIILTISYATTMIAAVARLPRLDGVALLATQTAALTLFWFASGRVDPGQKVSISRFYRFLWGLFYAQYIILSSIAVAQRLNLA